MPFEPVAIIGQSCVLPGALNPDELWSAIASGKDLLSDAPPGYWRTDPKFVQSCYQEVAKDICWTDRGGYVQGFESIFDAEGFSIPVEEITKYGTLVHWLLHTAREALRDAGLQNAKGQKAGIIFGNLSYPSHAMSEYAEAVWLDMQGSKFLNGKARELARITKPHPLNRFMSGLPAHIVAQALDLNAASFAIDAACASSLYAIKLACDKLHDRSADLMLAGGINASDDLILHIGFCTLQAMSQTGQSRPFHKEADGLVHAQGAGFLSLKRLDDAVQNGDPIHAVIRAVGLSNDGSGQGLLVPSREGQFKAMQKAYEMSGVDPSEINLLECHATGTKVGDAIEIASSSRIFEGLRDIPIGTIKSNMGHPITASGIAGIIKVTGAMKAGIRPRTLHVAELNDALSGSPFRVLKESEPWPESPKRMAGISNFGFGGNNAHLILEKWDNQAHKISTNITPVLKGEIAVIGMGAIVASNTGIENFARTIFSGKSALLKQEDGRVAGKTDSIDLPLLDLNFFPAALDQTLSQQLTILKATLEAVEEVSILPCQQTGVFVGMGCDGEVTRSGMCWRLAQFVSDWLNTKEVTPDLRQWIECVKDEKINPARDASAILGAMPNVVANRINSQFDFQGPSFTVSSEELSGVRSLEIAMRALRSREIDAAIVGAVDLSCEPIHMSAVQATLDENRQIPGDAAISLVLKRVEDARRDGDKIYVLLDGDSDRPPIFKMGLDHRHQSITPLVGHAHAASGLVHIAAAVLACHYRCLPCGDGVKAVPFVLPEPLTARIDIRATGKQTSSIVLKEDVKTPPRGLQLDLFPELHIYSGKNRVDVKNNLTAGNESDEGPARLVLVSKNEIELDDLRHRAAYLLENKHGNNLSFGQGIYYCQAPLIGEMAFVFAGPANDYDSMGRDIFLAFPALLKELMNRLHLSPQKVEKWIQGSYADDDPLPGEIMCRSSFLAIFQAMISQERLNLRPSAAIGYSSGESSSLFAMGAWQDMGRMCDDFIHNAVYSREIAGEFNVVKRSWNTDEPIEWTNWGLLASKQEVEKALENEPWVHLTIVNAPCDVIIGGRADACNRVIDKIGRNKAYFLNNNVVNHCPEINAYRSEWRKLHHRPTKQVPDVRFYTGATCSYYYPTANKAAESILGMATRVLDFPQMIENAWNDGVRIFVEHGPLGRCTGWIRQILGQKEHLAVAMDAKDRSSLDQMVHAAAKLKAGGVAIDINAINERYVAKDKIAAEKSSQRIMRRYAVHPPDIQLPPLEIQQPKKESALNRVTRTNFEPKGPPCGSDAERADEKQLMQPAPWLPPTMAGERHTIDESYLSDAIASDATASEQSTESVNRVMGKVTGMKNIIKSIVDQNGIISEIHQSFVKEHAKLQKRFLESSQNALAMLNHIDQYVSLKASPEIASFPIPSPAQKQMPKEREFSKPHLVAPPIIQEKPSRIDKDIKENHAPESIAPDLQEVPLTSAAETIDPVKAKFRNPVYLEPSGPQFSKEKLEILASGKISDVFGEMFAIQDDFTRQVRLPEYPLLLADRITGLQAEPGSMDQGIIWTETDVTENAWYLNDIYMPAGITVESGQCDLTLISYLGADFQNKGKRVYRLLGCDLMYYGDPPRVGDTLCYQIHVDGHANIGETRIFFFHYDCRINGELRLSVRNAQAGFFSDSELANSGGVLWDPCTGEHKPDSQAKVEPPVVVCSRKDFSIEQVQAFSLGNVYACFGPGFELACTHSKTPKIQSGMMLLIDKVADFDPKGGPWGRGYLRIENKIPTDAWYLTCHFKNDPCMPGTLMSDACLQALAFYMTAMGFTLNRDGWRFDPVPDEVIQCRCRGQVVPESEDLIYEVFVDEIEMVDGLYPTIFADILATCDGLKILHMRHMGLRLVPDWPLDCWPHLLKGHKENRTIANINDMHFGYHSLLACAFGKPSDAFGKLGELFDNGRHIARLPGPPYHFMSRVSRIDADMGAMKSGQTIEVEYDVPRSEWYFKDNNHTMPFCVLMEVALQPCGWLAVFEGGPNTSNEPLYFRNLDGTGTVSKEIVPDTGILKTRTTLTNIANIAGVTLVNFDVKLFVDDEPVYNMTTGFGFFKKEALAYQVGLEASEADIMWLDEPNDFHVELTDRPAKYFGGKLKLPGPMLLMIDRITGFWPDWGEKSLGRLRAEKTVDINEWFFKAHFFHDPVQPGSLGVEAIIQTLEFYMIHQEMHKGFKNPCFESVAKNNPVTWKYRGQVTPDKKRISIELNILDKGQAENGVYAVAEGWLWVDDLRIFNVKNLRIDIKEGTAPTIDDLIIEQVVDLTGVDSGQVHFIEDKNAAICQSMPFTLFPVVKSDHEKGAPLIEIKAPCLDFDRIIAYGRKNVGVAEPWAGENILLGLCRQFTRRLIVDDVDSFEKTKGQSVLFLGNHQVQVESLLFPMLIQVLSERRVITIASAEHQKGWVGRLNDLWYDYPGVHLPRHIVYFDQNDRKSMFNILNYLKSKVLEDGISIFLHVEGKLGLSCRKPVSKMSSVFIDLAQEMKLPIVPVRFAGGLPIDEMKETIDFPIGYGKQDYYVGCPIACEEIEAMPYAKRRKHVVDAINNLGPSNGAEMPHLPDTAFEKSVKERMRNKNVSEVQAVLFTALENSAGDKDIDALRLIEKDRNSKMQFANDEKGLWLSRMDRFLSDVTDDGRIRVIGPLSKDDQKQD
jgi:acyl transferase domain-containing protein/3-hydroxymyristoyl/3-hydroxydecanoyl-(acyl carrier protein) dehydratase